MPVPTLPPPDIHYLNAAIGWLELGNHLEAQMELEKISAENREQPDTLEIQWRICAAGKDWPDALILADKLVQIAPNNPVAWINHSYTLHELKRTQEAWDELFPAAARFPATGIIHYNLACYACQLGQISTAQIHIQLATTIHGAEEIKRMADQDPDLAPIRDWILNMSPITSG